MRPPTKIAHAATAATTVRATTEEGTRGGSSMHETLTGRDAGSRTNRRRSPLTQTSCARFDTAGGCSHGKRQPASGGGVSLVSVGPGGGAGDAVAALWFGAANGDDVEPVRARLECTNDFRSDAHDVPLAKLEDLVI
jgi:hypothetical protein